MKDHRCSGNSKRKAYLIGGGIASLSAAVFLIRDGGFSGQNIVIFDESNKEGNEVGGSLDGSGSSNKGYVIRGGRMLNFETFECLWDLLKSIPSIDKNNKTVFDDIVDFNKTFRTNSKARLVDKAGEKIDASKLGLSNRNRFELLRLKFKSEKSLERMTIDEYFSPRFFKTNFWIMWATMFSFHRGHSLVEFRRYMIRFFHEFYRLHTLGGVRRTRYNQYDSLILPIVAWLKDKSVGFEQGSSVVDIDFKMIDDKYLATCIHYIKKGEVMGQALADDDLVLVTNGSITDSSSLGSMSSPPKIKRTTDGADSAPWRLWKNIAKGKAGFGNPDRFCTNTAKTSWESFTVTMKDPKFINLMVRFSHNMPGTGGLVTFKDSNWLLSVVVPAQPHFRGQPADISVFWGYGFFPDRKGNFVGKKMSECSGKEILYEVCSHLKIDAHIPQILKTSNCIPCMMPFITSQFMPRKMSDRPKVVPHSSLNIAFIGQYCEVPFDTVFTVEYSVRSAQIAVYSLLCIKKNIPQIYEGDKELSVLVKALVTLFR